MLVITNYFMAMFNSYVSHYQRANPIKIPLNHHFPMVFLVFPIKPTRYVLLPPVSGEVSPEGVASNAMPSLLAQLPSLAERKTVWGFPGMGGIPNGSGWWYTYPSEKY